MKAKTYSELRRLQTFEDRFAYLSLRGVPGDTTFGLDRYLNQVFYNSSRWKSLRDATIIRDNACDLGIMGRDIFGGIRVHHMNPITMRDLELQTDWLLDPEFLICTSLDTHNAIHFGNEKSLIRLPIERKRGDTAPWKVF